MSSDDLLPFQSLTVSSSGLTWASSVGAFCAWMKALMSLMSTVPSPTAPRKELMLEYLYFFINSRIMLSGSSSFQFLSRRSSSSRPSAAFLNSASLSSCLMRLLALEVTTQFSQSCVGRWFLPVMISTTSPVASLSLMETALPLTRAPVHLAPMPLWILKAKSSTDEPAASLRSSPEGVNTKISLDGGAGRSSSPS